MVEKPEVFDELRSYRPRLAPGKSHMHSFVSTYRAYLHFGHGRSARLGRVFACLEMRLVLIEFAMSGGFKLVDAWDAAGEFEAE